MKLFICKFAVFLILVCPTVIVAMEFGNFDAGAQACLEKKRKRNNIYKPSRKRRRRAPNIKIACQACRGRHEKCSGGNPCVFCKKSDRECVYLEPKKRGSESRQKKKELGELVDLSFADGFERGKEYVWCIAQQKVQRAKLVLGRQSYSLGEKAGYGAGYHAGLKEKQELVLELWKFVAEWIPEGQKNRLINTEIPLSQIIRGYEDFPGQDFAFQAAHTWELGNI